MTNAEYAAMRKRLNDQAQALASSTKEPKLKLFACTVVYADRTLRGSWFTLLDVDEHSAKKAVIKEVHELNRRGPDRGPIGYVEVNEIEGPFKAGQLLHSEG